LNIKQIVKFHNERFFEGAVQLSWLQRHVDRAQKAAEAFVFHGPRYHGAGAAESEGIEGAYKLKDTASFVSDLLGVMRAGADGREVNPYWLVVAGYGSGKSHLALTCATLLANPFGETAQAILIQITRADPAIGEIVARQVETMGKPALVLPLDGMAGFHLGNALSRSVFEQLRLNGVDAGAIRDLSPRFQTAEQFVERNFNVRPGSFAKRLSGLNAEQVIARLRENDEVVYTAVDVLYNEANGHPIPIEGQESAQELIDTLCKVYCGPNGPFSHVLILFDELGRYLEYASEKPQLAGDFALQQIFQGVQDNATKVQFVGFIQYELKAYLKRFSGVDLRQLQRYVTRFDTANKWYLSTNLETIFAHMIGKEEEALGQLWQQTGAKLQFKQSWQLLSQCLPGFSRFPVWNEPESFERVIAMGCWPLHPFAVWFLTRQRDLVQSRSALTFIKDVIDRIADEEVQVDGRLRQVSAAELVIGNMLPELISAERETGSSSVETLQMLLEKFSGHLDSPQQMVLAGVAVVEKTRIGKQSRAMANALLCEATTIDITTLHAVLEGLSELGSLEWNEDLGQYELLSDGVSRAQFQQWLRIKQAEFKSDGIRDLFVRRGAADIELGNLTTDFAQSREISTQDWFFEAQFAHVNSVENTIKNAFQEWVNSTLPKDAKGKLIYLYLHPDDDQFSTGELIQTVMNRELERLKLPQAPIWVVGILDQKSTFADHIVRLYLLDEHISVSDQERFRRFIPEERERSRIALRNGAQEAIQERLSWIAGFSEVPAGRLRTVGLNIFNKIYPGAISFPFDGFGSAAGGGAADALQLTRGLIARQVNGPWVQSQPKRLQNRVDAVLVQSWKVLLPSGKLVAPTEPTVRGLYQWLEHGHQDNPQMSLLTSYRALIAPPYGLNASSAGLLLGLLLGLESPPRRLELAGELVASAEWLHLAFPTPKGRHHFNEDVLRKTRLRFLSEDSEDRWRGLLNRWEAEKNYECLVQLAREAEKMVAVDPLPEILEGNYKYLRDRSDSAAKNLMETKTLLENLEMGIEKAVRLRSVHHALELGCRVLRERTTMDENSCWPVSYSEECDSLLSMIHELITNEIAAWIPGQLCHNIIQVTDFRKRTESEARCLAILGFKNDANKLTQQAMQSIQKVEKLQQFSLTLAKCNDYPRQPEPTISTPVRSIRDDISLGDELIKGVQIAEAVLSSAEIAAIIHSVTQRQKKLKTALDRHQEALGEVYEFQLDSQEKIQEALTKINRLRNIFVGMKDEGDINELAIQLDRILSDVRAWGGSDVSVERLEELLTSQTEHQLAAIQDFLESNEIDPAWDLAAIYKSLVNEKLEAARRRSTEWVESRKVSFREIASLDRQRCSGLAQELVSAPASLAVQDATYVCELMEAVKSRLTELDELERCSKVLAWQRKYFDLDNLKQLSSHEAEQLLQGLRTPPCELKPKEQEQLRSIENQLTEYLDQLSLDELVGRIKRLSEIQRHELLKILTELFGA
jgi:hypothetical protein